MSVLFPFLLGEGLSALRFPVLLYAEEVDGEKRWVGDSLLTSTVSVKETPEEALQELLALLAEEIEWALECAKGNQRAAWESIYCPAPDEVLVRYFSRNAEDIPDTSIRVDGTIQVEARKLLSLL